jgi:hypothetical protein
MSTALNLGCHWMGRMSRLPYTKLIQYRIVCTGETQLTQLPQNWISSCEVCEASSPHPATEASGSGTNRFLCRISKLVPSYFLYSLKKHSVLEDYHILALSNLLKVCDCLKMCY